MLSGHLVLVYPGALLECQGHVTCLETTVTNYIVCLSLQPLYYDVEQTGSLIMLKRRKLRLTADKSLTRDHSLRKYQAEIKPQMVCFW